MRNGTTRNLDDRLARGPLRVNSVWSPGSPERIARRILRRRRFWFGLDAVAVCACIALVFAISKVSTRAAVPAGPNEVASQSLPSPSAAVESPPGPGRMTAFADGSVAESSSRETELVVAQDTPHRVVAKLTGGARFQVVHDPKRTFEVRAGDVRVRVLGTVFSVQQLPSGLTQVLVERGRVEVAWLGGATLLDSGQGGAFPPAVPFEGESDPSAATKPLPGEPEAGVARLDPAPAPASARAPGREREQASRGAGWRDSARAGDYGKAYAELHGNANANANANAKEPDAVRDEAGDLMLAADVARLSAHPADALRPLRGVCERHARDRRAPVAAFTLGRVLLDDLGRPSEAAAAFQKAHALWPEGPLAEDALAREAEAWDRAGRADGARAAAGAYLGRYPQGRHAAGMRKILGQ